MMTLHAGKPSQAPEWAFSFVRAGFRINYGFTRGIGSVALVLISVALGLLIGSTSSRALPVTGLVLCAVQFLAFLLFQRFAGDGKKSGPFGERDSTLPAFLRNNPRYSVLLAGVVLCSPATARPAIS